jgi:hypothetical protein
MRAECLSHPTGRRRVKRAEEEVQGLDKIGLQEVVWQRGLEKKRQ